MSKKRVVVGLLAGSMVFSMVIGMAASLGGLSSDGLGAEDAVVAACDSNGVTTEFTTSYSASGTAGYKVGDVTVGGIADACDGASMSVTLTGSGGNSLGEQTATVDVDSTGGDTSDVVSFSGSSVLAESVTGVHVVVAN
jgi:hypothetical protein